MSVLSPDYRVNRRRFADPSAVQSIGLARRDFRDMVRRAVRNPYPTTTHTAHHFRTPSPRGQPDLTPRLPTSFSSHNALIQQGFACFGKCSQLPSRGTCHICITEVDETPGNRGSEQCKSELGLTPLRQALCLWAAVRRSPSKPSLVQVQVRRQQSCWMANRSRERSLAQQAICFIAKPTLHNAATDWTTRRLTPIGATSVGVKCSTNGVPRSRVGCRVVGIASRAHTRPFSHHTHEKPARPIKWCAGFFASHARLRANTTCNKRTHQCSKRS